MPKTKGLTFKQRRWIEEYIKTGNASEAAMRAYNCKNREVAGAIGTENLQKLPMHELMEEMGLTDVALVNIGVEGLQAKKTDITGDVHPDYSVRHRYWDTLLKLKGKLNTTTIAQQFNLGEMSLEFIGDEGQTE